MLFKALSSATSFPSPALFLINTVSFFFFKFTVRGDVVIYFIFIICFFFFWFLLATFKLLEINYTASSPLKILNPSKKKKKKKRLKAKMRLFRLKSCRRCCWLRVQSLFRLLLLLLLLLLFFFFSDWVFFFLVVFPSSPPPLRQSTRVNYLHVFFLYIKLFVRKKKKGGRRYPTASPRHMLPSSRCFQSRDSQHCCCGTATGVCVCVLDFVF